MENFLDKLREIEARTAAVAANLRLIRDDGNTLDDLESLERQTAKIAANLHAIQEDPNDLDELERQSDKIVGNLRSIQEPSNRHPAELIGEVNGRPAAVRQTTVIDNRL